MSKKTTRKATNTNEQDELLDAALERYDELLMVYKTFEDKEQVLLFDLEEQRIYSYPYKEFRDSLNERSQATLKDQYERAQLDDLFVVFVRDNERRKFKSFSLPYE